MLLVPGGRFELGEWAACSELPFEGNAACARGGMVPQHPVKLDSFCIQTFSFPGRPGAPWPAAGPTLGEVRRLDERLLPSLGRRLCTLSELLLAAAGPDNWRYPYAPDRRDAAACDAQATAPSPMGSSAGCRSPTGLRDALVRPTWGRVDEATTAALAPVAGPATPPHLDRRPAPASYALAGGSVHTRTFYAASNFGLHTHTAAEPRYTDDALRLCADPGLVTPTQRRRYDEAVARFVASGLDYPRWLSVELGAQ